MSEDGLHSFVFACDFRVDDVEQMWEWLRRHAGGLTSIGARHVVLYTSIWEPGRVLVTIGIKTPDSIPEVLRSPAIFDWFTTSGVEDIPPIFGGEVVEKIDLRSPAPQRAEPAVIVGAVAAVEDVPALLVEVHGGLDRFRAAGVRKIWVYRALDDGHEVMILQEIDDETDAHQWITHPDAAAEWMSGAGFGAYPSLFVGTLAHLMSLDQQG
jgi:hypothetical protein